MIYISGKMTGEKNLNYPLFDGVAKSLREQGKEVFTPSEIILDKTGLSEWGIYEGYMDICLEAVENCDTIYLLNGWNNSKGAKRELKRALELGLNVIMQGDFI